MAAGKLPSVCPFHAADLNVQGRSVRPLTMPNRLLRNRQNLWASRLLTGKFESRFGVPQNASCFYAEEPVGCRH
jgi:hypothetical protein